MSLQIYKKLDPILRQATENVTDFGFEFQKLVDEMVEIMRKKKGIGLAAPQVGIAKKMFICEFEGDEECNFKPFPLTVICNPEVVETSKTEANMVEGCLSFPGMELLIKRPKSIKIKGQDRYGKNIEIEADSIFGRVIQHEIDHLNSVLFIDHLQKLKVIFIGTGTLGVYSLEALARDQQYEVLAVVTSDIVASGRQAATTINPIAETAKKLKLPIMRTNNINDPKIIEKIKELKPDLGIMADFGQIVSQEVLALPSHGIINIHPSLLPRHRGSTPIPATILAGDKEAGVSLILTSSRMDAGGIISQVIVKLSGSETTTILKDYLSKIASSLLLNSIPYYIAGDLPPVTQEEGGATYARILKKEDGLVDESTAAVEVERKIRAFDQWPKVYTMVNGKRIQLLASHFAEDGSFVLDRVKPEGKNEMTYDEYLRGYKKEMKFQ